MTKCYTYLCMLLLVLTSDRLAAQTTVSTTSAFTNNNGSGTVTFNLQNSNSSAVVLTTIKGVIGTTGTTPVEVWYKTTPINGAPGVISTANGWNRIDSTSITSVGNTTTTTTQTFFTNINFTLPGSTTYGFAIYGGGQRYYTIPSTTSTTSTTAGGVSIITGFNVSYGGGAPNGTAPGNALRGWIGEITFVASSSCTSPPTAGTTTANPSTSCSGGNVTLGLTGNSFGTSQTYQLQSSATLTGAYTNVGSPVSAPTFTVAPTASTYYRVAVTCSTSTVNSTPVLVTVNPAFAGGTYTINKNLSTGGTNFNSFADAVSAISCGVSGPVTFNVTANTGPYTAQVSIPAILGTSATNTVTFNGNGNTINYNASVTGARAGILLDGADWIRITNLNINSTGTYGFGVQMINSADNNIVSNCTITNPTTSTATNYAGIVISGSATSATTSGSDCDSNQLINNTITGGYYAITDLGDATIASKGNLIKGNTLSDFYLYGVYLLYNTGSLIDSNNISRAGRTTTTTFYGVYMSTGNLATTVSRNRIHNTNDNNPGSTSTVAGVYTSSDAALGTENIVVNNLIYNFNNDGIQYGLYNSGGAYCKYLHNTVSLDDTSSTSSSVTRGFYQTGLAAGLIIKNNIFSLKRTGTGAKTVLYFGTATSTIASDYNDLFLIPNTGATNDIGYSGSGQSTLASWQANASQDAHSISFDPQFVLPASGNLTPGNIAVDDTGVAAGITTDINGAPRSSTKPDLGAYEFHIQPPCNAPTGLFASAVSNRTATIGWNSVAAGVGYQFAVTNTITPPASGTAASGSPVALAGLTASTKYYYHVRTVCNSLGIYYSVWKTDSFTTCTPPPAAITAAASSFCQGSSLTLNATAGTGLSYQFLLNNNLINGATNTSYVASVGGSYRVIISNSACGDTSAPFPVTVNPLPVIGVSPATATAICAGTSVALTASGAVTYSWSPAATLSASTGATVTASPGTTTTTYTVTGTDANGCVNAATKQVVVNALPNIAVSPSTTVSICATGGSATLTASGGVSYSWSPATGLSATTGSTVSASPTATTTYTVTGTDANGCVNTATKAVNVSTPPSVSVSPSAATTICSGTTVSLTASGAVTYSWTPATGLSATTGATINATPTSTTTYTVTGTDADGCTGTATKLITVNASPALTLSNSAPAGFCIGGSATLTASGAQSYVWAPSTGLNTVTGTTVTAAPSATTTYSVTGTAANGCTKTLTQTVTVHQLPTVTVNPPTTAVCKGTALTLTAGGATIYSWSPTAGLSSTSGSTVVATPLATTTYTITGTDINGCVNTATRTLTVNTPPTLSINPSTAIIICNGSSAGMIASGATSYSWTPVAGLSNPGTASVTASPSVSTTYTVTGTDLNGCTGTAIKTVIVNQLPNVNISPTTAVSVCSGAGATLTASGAVSYTWTPTSSLSTGTGPVVMATPAANTTYVVTGIDANGCSNTASRLVTVLGRPTIGTSVSGLTTICPGTSVSIGAFGANTYSWTPAGTLSSSTGSVVVATPPVTTTYTVTGTALNGCSNTTTRTISVRALPVSDITPNSYFNICQDDSVTLIAAPGYDDYKWMIYGTVIAPAVTNMLTTATGGIYTLMVTDNVGCTSTSTVPAVISVIQRPVPVITMNGGVLQTAPNFLTYTWYRNGVAIPGANGPSYAPVLGGLYTVGVAADTNMCVGTSKPYQYTAVSVNGTAALGAAIRLYPNPAHNVLQIDAPLSVAVSVRSMDGKTIFQGADVKTINTRGWADGVYQVTVRDHAGNVLKIEKLIKVAQ